MTINLTNCYKYEFNAQLKYQMEARRDQVNTIAITYPNSPLLCAYIGSQDKLRTKDYGTRHACTYFTIMS